MAVLEQRMIGPAEAAELLQLNTNNRNLKKWVRARYAWDMKRGAWKDTGLPIVIHRNGATTRLEDGQHRLHAIIDSGVTLPMWISVVTETVFDVVDQGVGRSLDDLVGIKTGAGRKDTDAARALALIEYVIDRGLTYLQNVPKAAVVELLDAYPRDVAWAVDYIGRYRAGNGHRRPVMGHVAAAIQCYRVGGEMATRFFDQVASGEDLRRGDPAYTLRNALARATKSGMAGRDMVPYTQSVTVRAWDAYRDGRDLLLLKGTDHWLLPRAPHGALDIAAD